MAQLRKLKCLCLRAVYLSFSDQFGSRGSTSQFNLKVTEGHDDLLVAVSELIAALRSLAEEEEQTLTF